MRKLTGMLGSVKLGVALLIALAAAMGCGTIIEARGSAELARKLVYSSGWFIALLTALAVNLVFSLIHRPAFRRQTAGYTITHTAVIVILAGALVTHRFGVTGFIQLAEGEETDRYWLTDIAVTVTAPDGSSATAVIGPYGTSPTPGEHTRISLAGRHYELVVLDYYPHCRVKEDFAPGSRDDPPAARVSLRIAGMSLSLIHI